MNPWSIVWAACGFVEESRLFPHPRARGTPLDSQLEHAQRVSPAHYYYVMLFSKQIENESESLQKHRG